MMKNEETWLGMGVKSGGMIFLAGYESVTGDLWNLKNTNDKHTFNVKSTRFGIGLGGGGDATLVCIFKTKNIYQINGKRLDDWGFNFDMAKGRLKDVANLIKLQKSLQAIKLAYVLGSITVNLNEVRDTMSFLYGVYEVGASTGPSVHLIDVPLAGVGLEVSLFKSVGTLQIDNIKNQTTTTPPHRVPDFRGRGRNAS